MAEARQRGLYTIGFAGYDGGAFANNPNVDACFVVRSQSVHRIQESQALLGYQQAVQQSLRKCLTRSSAIAKAASSGQQLLLNRAAEDAQRLADIRYRGGATSYLEVPDSDTRMFSAELG